MKRNISILLISSILFLHSNPLKACHTTPIIFPGGGPASAIASGVMLSAVLGNVIRAQIVSEAPHMTYGDTTWNVITLFKSEKVWSTKEVSGFISLLDNDTLLSKNLLATLGAESSFLNVNNKQSTNKEVIILPGGEIKNNSMHIYYLKLPKNLANSKKDLKIETSFMYQIPQKYADNNEENNSFDIMVLPKNRYDKIASTISKELVSKKGFGEADDSNIIDVSTKIPCAQNNVVFEQKEFIIKKKLLRKHQEDFTFVVCQHSKKLSDDKYNHIRTYNAVLKIK